MSDVADQAAGQSPEPTPGAEPAPTPTAPTPATIPAPTAGHPAAGTAAPPPPPPPQYPQYPHPGRYPDPYPYRQGPPPGFAAAAGRSGVGAATLPRVGPPRPQSRFEGAWAALWRARPDVPVRSAVTAAAVGVAGGVVVVGHRPGLGAAFLGVAVWAGAAPTLVRRRAVADLALAALSVLLVAMVAVRDAAWVVAICCIAAAVLAAVAVTGARSAPAVLGSVVAWCAGALRSLPGVGRLLRRAARRERFAAVARTAAVTVVLLAVFGALFSSADVVFASYLPRVDVAAAPAQLVVGALVALVTLTLAQLAASPPGGADLRTAPGRPAALGEWATPLVALDAMVLAFVLVQVGGLLGGHAHVLAAADLSYAQYARQGFGQLVAATVLTLVVVGVAVRRAPRSTARDRLAARVVLGVLCVGTLGVVASALRRMDLYVEAFGLTRLRLLVLVAEGVLGVVLVLVVVAGVRWRGAWLPRTLAAVVGVAVLGLALANPDALILRHNTMVLPLVAADDDGRIGTDLAYLRGLSADAVQDAVLLDEPLRSCVLVGIDVDAPSGPLDWNLGRAQAADALAWLGGDVVPGDACTG